MAHKTYLALTNDILGELNEVQLTSTNFTSATGIQKFIKDAINRAYFDIANENPEFPWLSNTVSGDAQEYGNSFVDTVAGTRWYFLRKHSSGPHGTAKDFGKVDWDNFYLTTEGVGSCSVAGACSNVAHSTASACVAAGATWTDYDTESVCTTNSGTWTSTHTAPHNRQNLKFIPIEVWKKHYRESEDSAKDTGVYGQPVRVIMSPDGRKFGLSPLPDKAYRIHFYAWEQIDELSAHSDEIKYSEQWASVLLAKARYYVWQFKENVELSSMALEEYKKGIRLMRAHTGKPQPSTMTDDRIRFV
jgi:hypothetical protein